MTSVFQRLLVHLKVAIRTMEYVANVALTYDDRQEPFHFILPDPNMYSTFALDVGSPYIKMHLLSWMRHLDHAKQVAIYAQLLTSAVGFVIEKHTRFLQQEKLMPSVRHICHEVVATPVRKKTCLGNVSQDMLESWVRRSTLLNGPFYRIVRNNWTRIRTLECQDLDGQLCYVALETSSPLPARCVFASSSQE